MIVIKSDYCGKRKINMGHLKTIAVYLPQYYENEYNNKWWGKGFTDWTAVKKANPCFDGHKQPKIPIKNNYYDLLDKNTLIEQSKLMKKYGVYGLCFYHYYFKDGVKVLEKPAENLLQNRDIDIPFCFSWASEKWIRTWSNFYGNVWGEKFDKDEEQIGNGVLLEQDFGTEKEWKEHFEYLLPFFLDERYIRIDGKPVFVFYHAEQVFCIKEMLKYWNTLALKNGLEGLYIIGAGVTGGRSGFDAAFISEPTRSRKELLKKGLYTIKNGVTCFKYEDFVSEVLTSNVFLGTKTYFCGVPGYDTTPRRGTNGECFLDNSSELFKKMMDGLYKKSIDNGNEYLFINAWNEWGEGMYLEPDEENGYSFLEVIKELNTKYKDIEVKNSKQANMPENEMAVQIETLNEKMNKFRYLYENAINMATIIQSNTYSLNDYFKRKNIETIAVYGVGPLGKLLVNQIMLEGIKINYTVDIYAARIQENLPMYRPYEELPNTDIMIVTAYGQERIIERMKKKGIKNVVSMETWMNDVMSGV